VLEGSACPTRLSEPSPATASKTSSSAASSCRKIEAAFAEKIPARLDDRLEQGTMLALGGHDAGGDGGLQILVVIRRLRRSTR